MAEWSIAPDLKSGKGNTFQGSNPCLSVALAVTKCFRDSILLPPALNTGFGTYEEYPRYR